MKFLSLALFFLSLCGQAQDLKKLDFMFYNVQNLFDTEHDEGKDDWTFLPMIYPEKKNGCKNMEDAYYQQECLQTDWTKEKLAIKLSQIKEVVTVNNQMLPDFLGLCEVENDKVLKMLGQHLGNFQMIMANGPDKRGIDVALFYKVHPEIKYLNHKEHELKGKYFDKKPTRTILEVNFKIKENYHLTILVNHWPSQANPSDTRIIAAKKVLEVVSEGLKKNRNQHFVVMGDFNTLPEDYPHPFKGVIFKDGNLVDLHSRYHASQTISIEEKSSIALGTYFYSDDMSWNMLDRFLVSKNLLRGTKFKIKLSSYQIFTPDPIRYVFKYEDVGYNKGTQIAGVPKGYDFQATKKPEAGYSDHFPIKFSLDL